MPRNRMRPLSIEGSREVIEEMSRPPEDTPARRRMLERARAMAEVRKRQDAEEHAIAKE